MTGGDLACFRDQSYPDVILQLLIKEAHLRIGVLGVMGHCVVINTSCTIP